MKSGKQIVYRYNGDPGSEEVELDLSGDVTLPVKGSFITRKGSRWKVVQVEVQTSVTDPGQLPVYRIFLTDNF